MKLVLNTLTNFSVAKHFLTGALMAFLPMAAQATTLTFDQMIGQTSGQSLLGPTAGSSTIYFRDVATENGQTVDARITTTIIGETHFAEQNDPNAENYFGDAGFIPDYNNSFGGPQEDLGFLYYGNGINGEENGLTMTMEFFDGTASLSGSFLETLTLSNLEFAIYDVDGEASQSEYFSVRRDDGLVSYATGTSSQALVATDLSESVRFDGLGTNYSESDATGAAILYYELTDMVEITFGSLQSGGPYQNAVFSAIDGDLSLFANGSFDEPIAVTSVPLPASGLLLLLSIAGCFLPLRKSRALQIAKGFPSVWGIP
ncbi:hypothetical protein ACOTTU_00020 [Roseobacter sp. EG26]|uniref:hypothetical protein n=1 Tax=Roseobacter sp. EG26 TaxID=3412477 RepID=UPI003CE53DAB